MTKLIAIYDTFEVVKVPFPFTDRSSKKRRPAVILSSGPTFGTKARHSVMAMITSKGAKPWPLDVPIQDLEKIGLEVESVVRMKIFTLDHRLIIDHLGVMSSRDRDAVSKALRRLLKLR